MTNKLELIPAIFLGIALSFTQCNRKISAPSDGGDTNIHLLRPHTGQVRWWRHNNENNTCVGIGVYCFRRKLFTELELTNGVNLESDETLNEISTELKNNTIVIKSIGAKGELTSKTIEAFKNARVEILGGSLSQEVVSRLFKDIGLESPKEGLGFKKDEQSYSVYSTTYNGKSVDIVEAIEKTTVSIGDKSYRVIVITTSGRGIGSPKVTGF